MNGKGKSDLRMSFVPSYFFVFFSCFCVNASQSMVCVRASTLPRALAQWEEAHTRMMNKHLISFESL